MTGVAFDLSDREVKLMRKSSAAKEPADIETPENLEQDESTNIDQLQAEIEVLKAERDQLEDRAKRALADSANIRRRAEQDQMKAREIATRGMLSQLVPIVDELKRGLSSMPEDEKNSAWAQGVQLIEKKLTALLEREGVAPIEALGKPFDPAVHEAVATEEGSKDNVVVEVYQTGYKLGQSLLRPAVVKVGDKPDFQA
jgi:molecular chaperone GrpE